MLKEGVRLDRVRGGRQKYRRNPAANPYHQLMLSQAAQSGSVSGIGGAGGHTLPASLDDIKLLETVLAGEPDVISVGADAAELMCPQSWRASAAAATAAAAASAATAALSVDDSSMGGGSCSRMDEDEIGEGGDMDESAMEVLERKPNAAQLAAQSTAAMTTPTTTTSAATGAAVEMECGGANAALFAVPEMLSVLSDLYDKELVGVIGWAKQIPGKNNC